MSFNRDLSLVLIFPERNIAFHLDFPLIWRTSDDSSWIKPLNNNNNIYESEVVGIKQRGEFMI